MYAKEYGEVKDSQREGKMG